MISFFYGLAILFILVEFASIGSAKQMHEARQEQKLFGKTTDATREKLKGVYAMHFLYLIWACIGMFSSQWIIFLALMLMSLFPKTNVLMRKIDATICILILFFLLVNYFHLDWDVLGYIKSTLNP